MRLHPVVRKRALANVPFEFTEETVAAIDNVQVGYYKTGNVSKSPQTRDLFLATQKTESFRLK